MVSFRAFYSEPSGYAEVYAYPHAQIHREDMSSGQKLSDGQFSAWLAGEPMKPETGARVETTSKYENGHSKKKDEDSMVENWTIHGKSMIEAMESTYMEVTWTFHGSYGCCCC